MASIFQSILLTRFLLPFLLIFFILYGILEKTKIFGDDKTQLNALISFIISLIFIGFTYPTEVANNLVLFLTIAMIAMFVGLILWGVLVGEPKLEKLPKKGFGVLIIIAVIGAVIWATGSFTPFADWLFGQQWSGEFWTNVLFIIVIAIALGLVWKGTKKSD